MCVASRAELASLARALRSLRAGTPENQYEKHQEKQCKKEYEERSREIIQETTRETIRSERNNRRSNTRNNTRNNARNIYMRLGRLLNKEIDFGLVFVHMSCVRAKQCAMISSIAGGPQTLFCSCCCCLVGQRFVPRNVPTSRTRFLTESLN